MKTNEILGMQITERDEGALKFLEDIKWSNLADNKGFKLDFYFDSNPYFKNTLLSKTYHMIDDDEPILERAVGTEIEWNMGKNMTQKVLKKKPKKGAKNAKPVTKTEQCDSFFNFFNPPQVPDNDDMDQDTVGLPKAFVAMQAEQLQDLMEQDYDIGSTIRDKIIPHAVSWFTGEALQGEEFEDEDEEGDGDGDGDDEDEDEDDEEEDEEEEDDDEEQVRGRKRRSSPIKAVPEKTASGRQQQAGEQPPECKQQ